MFLPVIIVGWLFVVMLLAVAEATSSQGTVLGAMLTFVGWGLFPLAIVIYILATPMRQARRARQEAEAAQAVTAAEGRAKTETQQP